jgi:hypothetical protein
MSTMVFLNAGGAQVWTNMKQPERWLRFGGWKLMRRPTQDLDLEMVDYLWGSVSSARGTTGLTFVAHLLLKVTRPNCSH